MYDEAAQSLGAEVATSHGGSLAALADIATIAHGSVPDGFVRRSPWGYVGGRHEGIDYVYVVSCRDDNAKPMICGETTATAHAIAGWGGTTDALTVWHQGTWDLRGLHGGLGLANGASFASYGDGSLYVRAEAQLVMDFGSAAALGGAVQASIDRLDAEGAVIDTLDGDVVFDRVDRAALRIEDQRYWLDPATGVVSAAAVLE
ncbi:MAG TPA: hypothetical protein VIV40_35075 [Kofleriaceae bacterium]